MRRIGGSHLHARGIEDIRERRDLHCLVARRIGIRDILGDDRLTDGQPARFGRSETKEIKGFHDAARDSEVRIITRVKILPQAGE